MGCGQSGVAKRVSDIGVHHERGRSIRLVFRGVVCGVCCPYRA